MLLKLNERIQGVVAWVVIILIALTFMLFGVDYYMQSHQSNDTEVTINGQPLLKQTVELNYRRTRQQRDPAQWSAASDAALHKQILNDMIINLISVQGALAGGFDVSSKQADSAILSIPQFQQDGHFSQERYTQALSGAMFTHQSFQKEVKQGMLLNQQRFAFIGSAFALKSDLKRFVQLVMQNRDYDYLIIPSSLFLKKSEVSEESLLNYYKKNSGEFLTPESVSIDYVELSLKSFKDKVKINDEAVKHYYEENQSSFLKPAQWKVAHILIPLAQEADSGSINKAEQQANKVFAALEKNPEQFSQWVKTSSADKLSVKNEGVLPWISAGQTAFDTTLATLTRPNQIAKPLRTPHGFEIFKLITYRPAKLESLDAVKQKIVQHLVNEAAQKNYTDALEQLTDLSFQTPDSLQPIMDALDLKLQTSEQFSRLGGQTKLTKNKKLVEMAFSHDILELGNNSDPISLGSDSVIVMRVNKHIHTKKQPFDQVKSQIIDKIAILNAQNKVKQWGQSFLKDHNNRLERNEIIINQNTLKWQTMLDATRDQENVNPAINESAFTLTANQPLSGIQLPNGDYAIVHLKKINNGNYEALDKEQKLSITQQIESNYGSIDYELYINALVKQAKIERN